MNPIVKRFNKTNNNYKLNFADSYGYLREELQPKNQFYLTDKQGNFPSEFDVGAYGYKCFDIFPLIETLFIECFGKGTSNTFERWGIQGQDITWEYDNYILRLAVDPEHPKTSGYHLRITIDQMVDDESAKKG